MKPGQRTFERLEDVDLRDGPPVVLTIGTFDGVHLAHRQLLDEAVMRAGRLKGIAAALTFRNHPRAIVSPDNVPPLLTDWETKRDLVLARGIHVLIGLEFSREFAATEAGDFVREAIAGRLAARVVISGPDFHFGRGARGNATLLTDMSESLGYAYIRRDPIVLDGAKVSSTRIREALAGGDVTGASRLLVRPHRNIGKVVRGDGVGRRLGFPTANLEVDRRILVPGDGVYAVRVSILGVADRHPAMMNIGWRPTVGGTDHRKEIHLIGFEGDLVGRTLSVDYIARIRSEQRFANLEELRYQLGRDREAALELLKG